MFLVVGLYHCYRVCLAPHDTDIDTSIDARRHTIVFAYVVLNKKNDCYYLHVGWGLPHHLPHRMLG